MGNKTQDMLQPAMRWSHFRKETGGIAVNSDSAQVAKRLPEELDRLHAKCRQ
jgi:hypothetical protein